MDTETCIYMNHQKHESDFQYKLPTRRLPFLSISTASQVPQLAVIVQQLNHSTVFQSYQWPQVRDVYVIQAISSLK